MNSRFFRRAGLATLLALALAQAQAAGFSAGISPSKFELRAAPGDVLRDTITIVNAGSEVSDYVLKTADWLLTDSGSIEFVEDALVDGSCRPWVRLERRTLRMSPGSQRNYRFEVHVPADAPAGLCRFAIIVEPAESVMTRIGDGDSAISVPVLGRYAVVTYVTIGDAKPRIEVVDIGASDANGTRLPVITLRNSGNTYDRAVGRLVAVDFRGERVALVPSSFPVLPGRTADIAIVPDVDAESVGSVALSFPLRLTGEIEIGGQLLRIDEVVE